MLLDTVCNVFGAVILMAILVVIQTQTSVARIPLSEESVDQTIANRQLRARINRLRDQCATLAEHEQALLAQYEQAVSPATDVLLQRRTEFMDALADVADRIAATEAATAEHVARQAELDEAAAETADLVAGAEQATAEWVRRLGERQREVRPIVSRLPVSHESEAVRQLSYLVIDDRVYPMDDAAHCRHIRLDQIRTRIQPISGAGLVVTNDGDNRGFLRTLAAGRTNTHYVTFFVAVGESSFRAVRVLRQLAANRGYDFGYALYERDEGLIVIPGKPDVE